MEPGTLNRTGAFLSLFLLVLPSITGAQGAAECPTQECAGTARSAAPASNRLWAEASAIHQLKLEFVDALQRFTRAQAGTFGDEGPELLASASSMREVLERWDRAVQQFQVDVERFFPAADAHIAVATVLLDRHRIEDALRELKAAERSDDGRADLYVLQALAYAVRERRQDAVRALRRATALAPGDPAPFYTLAQNLAHLGQSADASRARRDFQRALNRRSDTQNGTRTGAPRFDRIDLLRQVAGVAPIFPQPRYVDAYALGTGDYATAAKRFSDASISDPLVAGDPAARERIAAAASMIRAGRFDDALNTLRAALTNWPNEGEVHRLLGLAYWLNDQHGQSIEHVRTAISHTADDERARVMLADVLTGDRRLAEAERELRQGIEGGERSGRIHYQLAQLYERQSLLPQAAASFQESEAYGPIVGRDQFYRLLGSLRVNQADFAGAVAAYARRLDANPNSGEAHRQIGEIYFLQGRHDEALTEFLAATWLDPRDAKAHAAAGQVQVRLLNYADAVVALQRALALDAGLQEARYALGTSLMRLGKTSEARRELEIFERQRAETDAIGQTAFGLDAVRREASRSLLAGSFDQAIASYRHALTLDPDSARSHRDLGLALVRAKRAQEGIDHLVAAQKLERTAEGHAYLADAYNVAGDREESARQRALSLQMAREAQLDRIRELAR
jgi:tetratricopeptide (TPR) repeat protein